MMETKVLTAHVPLELSAQVDQLAERLDRSKGWIVKQALSSWISEEEERYQMTLDALKQVDLGQTIEHSKVKNWVKKIHVSH